MGLVYYYQKTKMESRSKLSSHRSKKKLANQLNMSQDKRLPKKKEYQECVCKINSCICSIIKEFLGKDVILRTRSGDEIFGVIKNIDKHTNCVTIIEAEMLSPMMPGRKIIISCKDIESISEEVSK